MKIEQVFNPPKGRVLVTSEPIPDNMLHGYAKINNTFYEVKGIPISDRYSVLINTQDIIEEDSEVEFFSKLP